MTYFAIPGECQQAPFCLIREKLSGGAEAAEGLPPGKERAGVSNSQRSGKRRRRAEGRGALPLPRTPLRAGAAVVRAAGLQRGRKGEGPALALCPDKERGGTSASLAWRRDRLPCCGLPPISKDGETISRTFQMRCAHVLLPEVEY